MRIGGRPGRVAAVTAETIVPGDCERNKPATRVCLVDSRATMPGLHKSHGIAEDKTHECSKGCLPRFDQVSCWPFRRLAKRLNISMPLLLAVAGWLVRQVNCHHVTKAEMGCRSADHCLQGRPCPMLDSYLLCPVGIVG